MLFLDPSKQQQHEDDDQNESQCAARIISPPPAMWPCRQNAKQHKQQDDDQNGSKTHGFLRIRSPSYDASLSASERGEQITGHLQLENAYAAALPRAALEGDSLGPVCISDYV